MNHTTRLASILLMSLALIGTAQAQNKKELAARAARLQQPAVDNIARSIASQIAQQMWQASVPALGQLPADKREAVAKEVQGDIKRFHESIESLLRDRATKLAPATLAPLLEDKFSEDELKQLIAWQESTTAKKFNEVAPGLLSGVQEKLMTDTRPTVEPKLRALEDSLRKKLGLPPPPAASAPVPAKKGGTPASE